MNAPNQGPEPDDFEQSLGRIPLKAAPAEWRAEIIATASLARAEARRDSTPGEPVIDVRAPRRSWFEGFLRLPLGWAALAAVWAFALLAGNVDRWLNGGSARAWVRVSATQLAHARIERAQLWAPDVASELEPDLNEPRRTRAPREALPRPRSDHRRRGTNDPFDVRFDRPLERWLA